MYLSEKNKIQEAELAFYQTYVGGWYPSGPDCSVSLVVHYLPLGMHLFFLQDNACMFMHML